MSEQTPGAALKNKLATMFGAKATRVGGYSLAAALLVAVIAIVANMLVAKLPITWTNIDITANNMFAFSEQTEQVMSALDEDVTVYWLVQAGSEDTNVEQLLQRYEQMSNHFQVVKKDPVIYPGFAAQYTDAEVENNSLIIVGPQRSRTIGFTDIYLIDTSYYAVNGTYTTDFDGEGALTSAVSYVTSAQLPMLYTLSGHGETPLSEALAAEVGKQNISAQELNLLAGDAVPDDASCLLIYAPTTDITAAEKEKIIAYLEQGGRLLLITNYSAEQHPNLADLTAYYGVQLADGVVLDTAEYYCLPNCPQYLLPDIYSHAITDPLADKFYVLLPVAQAIEQSAAARDTVEVDQLLKTSEHAYIKLDPDNVTTLERAEDDPSGQYTLAVAITELMGGGETRIVWFSTAQFLSEQADGRVGGANTNLFLNALNWMCEQEDSISITPKSMDYASLTFSGGAATLWTIVLVGLIPLAFVIIGALVIAKRRRR